MDDITSQADDLDSVHLHADSAGTIILPHRACGTIGGGVQLTL